MSVPSLHQLDFVAFDFKNDDQKVSKDTRQMGNMLRENYRLGFTSSLSKNKFYAKSQLIPLFITGKNNKIPNLVSIIWEIYSQWKLVSIWKIAHDPNIESSLIPKNYSFDYFASISREFQSIPDNKKKTKKKAIIKSINNAMDEYYFNYFFPITRSKRILINDSYSSFLKYTIAMNQSITSIINKNNNLFPLQIDFWIIPKSIMFKQYKHKKKDSYIQKDDDIIMNIEKRLKLSHLEYIKVPIKNEKDMSLVGISQLFSRKIIETLNPKKAKNVQKSQSNRRIMVIIDRRNDFYDFNVIDDGNKFKKIMKVENYPKIQQDTNNKKKRNINDQIYFYEVTNKYGRIPQEYIQEKLIYNTQTYLLPESKIQKKNNINLQYASNLWTNQLFLLSFHVNSAHDVKAYWYLNGSMMRFLPQNIGNIWPNYFYESLNKKDKQNMNEISDKYTKNWKLKVTDEVFDKYYKELMKRPKKEYLE